MLHRFTIEGVEHDIWLSRHGDSYSLQHGDTAATVALEHLGGVRYRLRVGSRTQQIMLAQDGETVFVQSGLHSHAIRFHDAIDLHAHDAEDEFHQVASAPMPGAVLAVRVTVGDKVMPGDVLVVIESMKLETSIKAARAGLVEKLHVAAGQNFDRDAPLVTLLYEAT